MTLPFYLYGILLAISFCWEYGPWPSLPFHFAWNIGHFILLGIVALAYHSAGISALPFHFNFIWNIGPFILLGKVALAYFTVGQVALSLHSVLKVFPFILLPLWPWPFILLVTCSCLAH